MGKKNYIIGIDAGTSQVKSVIFGKGGNELATSSKPVCLISPRAGVVDQDMNEVWENVIETTKDVIAKVSVNPEEIMAIAITAQGDGLWMIKEDGTPEGYALSWTDGRAADVYTRWCSDGTGEKIYDITGFSLYTGTILCLLRWLLENQPERVDNAAWLVDCKDWIKFKMTGEISKDKSFALLHNIKTREFAPEMIELCGFQSVVDKFPETRECADNHAPLSKEIASELGLPEGIPVFGGPFDVVASATGAGVMGEGDAAIILGTTTMMTFGQDVPNTTPKMVGHSLMHCFPEKWLRIHGTMCGTPNIEWAIKTFGQKYVDNAKENNTSVYYEIEKCISEINPGCDGVMYHPYLSPAGERVPFTKLTARAQFTGLTVEHTEDHLMRAVYEGIAFSVKNCMEVGEVHPKIFRVTGGGSKSAFLCQLLADVTGVEIAALDGNEFGAKGAAIAAGVALDVYPSAEYARQHCVHEKDHYYPDLQKVAKYDKLYEVYVATYKAMWDVWDLRAKIYQEI